MQFNRSKKAAVSIATVFSMVVSSSAGIGNFETKAAQVTTFEAESAVRTGANVLKREQCSGGAKAGDIGTIDGRVGTVTFTVHADRAGDYEMKVYACTMDQRTFYVTVNGDTAQQLVCNGDSFDEPVAHTTQIYLKKGENKIVFGNPNNPAPDLDKIEIVGNLSGGFVSIEAEYGRLNGAEIAGSPNLSNGYYVGYIGGGAGGTATYTVDVEEAGKRDISIYYAQAADRKVNVIVNGKSYPVECWNTGDWNTLCTTPGIVEAEFKKGENTIQLAGVDGADAPNIDRIQIEMSDKEAQAVVQSMINALPSQDKVTADDAIEIGAVQASYNMLLDKDGVDASGLNALTNNNTLEITGNSLNIEAEAATIQVDGELEVVYTDACSNNYYVGGMGSVNNGKLVFKVNAKQSSKRILNIYYITEQERKLNVAVNDGQATALTCRSLEQTDWFTPESKPVSLQVDLKAGENTIVLSATSGAEDYTPNIDRVEIELSEEEAADTVESMIAALPETMTEENKMVFNAVKKAYDDLKNKDSVANAAQLKELFGENQQENNNGNNTIQQVESFVVTFDSDGGSEVTAQTVKKGEMASMPANPEKAGYTFLGWYDGETKYDFSKSVEKNITLVAKWDGSGLKEVQETLLDLEYQILITDKTLYTEESWKALEDAYNAAKAEADKGDAADVGKLQGLVVDVSTAIQNLEVVGATEEKSYTVTIDLADGTEATQQSVKEGNAAIKPEDPVRKGYKFMGWYLADQEYDFATPVVMNIKIVAKWEANSLLQAQEAYLVAETKKLSLNSAFYTTESWKAVEDAYRAAKAEYSHEDAANAEDLMKLVNNLNVAMETLVMKDIKEKYLVTFDAANGTTVTEQVVIEGNMATEPKDPAKDGYTFVGWYLGRKEYDFDTPVEGDIELIAKWKGAAVQNTTVPTGTNVIQSTAATNTNAANTQTQTNNVPVQSEIKVQSISITGISRQIAAGEEIELETEVLPVNATNRALNWTTDNPQYATVDEYGIVSTYAAGKGKTVTVTATAADGSGTRMEYTIEIMSKAVKKIKLKTEQKTVKAGKKVRIHADIKPKGSAQKMNRKLEWISSDPVAATVNSKGVVKTKKVGKGETVKITAVATDGSGKQASIKIKIE